MKSIEGRVNWGIIGCGDVCEIKSGPAFNKVPNSKLVAVMRRDASKAQDYASRHGVPRFYSDADLLINDPEVNAIYVATPPSSHEEYALASIKAGKPVYIEKPLSIDQNSTKHILEASEKYGVRATGAYYRRRLPLFEEVKRIVNSGAIGSISMITMRLLQSPQESGHEGWRVDPAISGGGLFHDLGSHMLDIAFWLFGAPVNTNGEAYNFGKRYNAPDTTTITGVFQDGIALNGVWSFNVSKLSEEDECQIIGEKGHLTFSFFDANKPLSLQSASESKEMVFTNPRNVHLNLIRDTVNYFRDEGVNPCSVADALVSMSMIDSVKTRF